MRDFTTRNYYSQPDPDSVSQKGNRAKSLSRQDPSRLRGFARLVLSSYSRQSASRGSIAMARRVGTQVASITIAVMVRETAIAVVRVTPKEMGK